jgi:hypothetical protein
MTVLIGTVHAFLVPGEVSDLAVFDPTVQFRFEIYNDHVNITSPVLNAGASAAEKKAYAAKVKPNRTIDVTFTKRAVGASDQTNSMGQPVPPNLRRPLAQQATLTLGGFGKGVSNKGVYKADATGNPLLVTAFGEAASPPSPFQIFTLPDVLPGKTPQFFAGVVSDPFFFDVPAFSAFLDSLRAGTPNAGVFARARNTFAGYNVLAIALRIPTSLLLGSNGPFLGVDFLTQRHALTVVTDDGAQGKGAWKTVDRTGNPLVNLFIPYDQRNAYSTATAHDDVSLKFEPALSRSLNDLGVGVASSSTIAGIFLAHGDLLVLNTSTPNTGTNAAAAYPNGRRLQDDVADIFLTLINNGTTLGDGISAGATSLTATFPFLPQPNQPLYNTNVDDKTRN